MILFTDRFSPRLAYVAEFISGECLTEGIIITSDRQVYLNTDEPRINYSSERISSREIFIRPVGLLTETGIAPQEIRFTEFGNLPAFFPTDGDIPFDLPAAVFYLLSRYEEYLPHHKDMYGRFAHENALAFRHGFLDRPLINEWLFLFLESVKEKFPEFKPRKKVFNFLPTYDIDIAYSYKGRGLLRNTGGFLKSLLRGRLAEMRERWQVLRGKMADPYDSYDWLRELHHRSEYPALFFFLVAKKRGKYDKNLSPRSSMLQDLIHRISEQFMVGVHPSWRSGEEPDLIRTEIDTLAGITRAPIYFSRFHYIRFDLPRSYRLLISAGIRADHSMGYGSINGFRASVASPFYWYDLEKEEKTALLIYPFCFMEANSYFEQKQNTEQTQLELTGYLDRVKRVNGTFISIWHNNFPDPGWRELYGRFVEMLGQSGTVSTVDEKDAEYGNESADSNKHG